MGRRGATLSLRADFGKRDSCDSTSSERLAQITSYHCCQVLCTLQTVVVIVVVVVLAVVLVALEFGHTSVKMIVGLNVHRPHMVY